MNELSKARRDYSLVKRPIDTPDRLAKISVFYHREAKRCANDRAYFAACIFTGAALEAMLLSMCYVEDRAVRRAPTYKNRKFRSKRNRFFEFKLYQLINIAAELKWIPATEIRLNGRKTTLQRLLHAARQTRNMIHASAWANEGGPSRMRKSDYESIFEIFDVTRDWLLQHIYASLRRRMDTEDIPIPNDLSGTKPPAEGSYHSEEDGDINSLAGSGANGGR